MNLDFPNNTVTSSEGEEEINLRDIFMFFLMHWKWFVVSVLVCLLLAISYILIAPKEYSLSATVLIRNDSKTGGGIGESAIFQDLGMFNVRSSVDNEVLIFQSKRLMRDVTIRLHLDMSYKIKQGLRSVELYTQSPVQVILPDAFERQELSFVVTPLNEEEVELSSFSEGEKNAMIVALKDTIQTSLGRIVVSPTLYYGEVYYGKAIVVNKSDIEKVALNYGKKVEVALASKQSTLINLSLTDYSIPRAKDILNTTIAIYNEDAINDKNQITRTTSNFVAERLNIIQEELSLVDSDIEEFKRENRLTDISSETGMFLQESSMYNKEGLSLENRIALARNIYDYLVSPENSSELIPANTGIVDTDIESQINEYNTTLLKRNQYLSDGGSRNPMVMNLNNSLNAMRPTILRAIENLIVSLNIQIKNVESREQQTRNRISAVPSQSMYVLTVERQQKIKEELYLYLLNKREENELTLAITESNARVIDPATGSEDPVAPRSLIILAVSCMLGCILPAGYLYIRENMNNTVRDRKDIESTVTIPFLGEIPKRDKKDSAEILVRENGRDSVSEAFRIVRTNMEFMRMQGGEMKVITLTSALPGSGKTFSSTNLALSLAMTQKKVILVDLDIRKGTLSSNCLGKKQEAGITNYLSGQIDDIKSLVNTEALNGIVDLITAGPIPPNPTELLLNNRLEVLIDELKKEYDYIILDNVPTLLVADAYVINRVVDMTIYVVRVGLFDRRRLTDLEQVYRQKKLSNMAIVLNGVDYKSVRYGYGSGYGYGYGN